MAKRARETGASTTCRQVLAWLARTGTRKQVAELDRYGITARRPFGVAIGQLKKYAKEIGRDHARARELWASERYEARLLAVFTAEPDRLTVREMNQWMKDSDNWALVDTACFHLFDRSPLAWSRVAPWAASRTEFVRRGAFALLWSLSVHDKEAPDRSFLDGLKLVERAADDERNFVKKGVDMALRAIGKRNAKLNAAAVKVARRLKGSDDPTARWIGTHSVRELTGAAVRKKLSI